MPERYSDMSGHAGFGLLVNALGGGGDRGQSFPQSDAEDMSRGARFIPGEVTLARRAGDTVVFHYSCTPCCWYWEMPDGRRIYHWDGLTHDQIGRENFGDQWDNSMPVGSCPACGNPFTRGGTVTTEQVTNGAY